MRTNRNKNIAKYISIFRPFQFQAVPWKLTSWKKNHYIHAESSESDSQRFDFDLNFRKSICFYPENVKVAKGNECHYFLIYVRVLKHF